MNPIAVIPARANSQRLHQKNLRKLGGKPLTQWAVDAAKASGLFGKRIYVTTDDPAIMKLARSLGVNILARRRDSARADATLEYVMMEVRNQLNTRAPFYVLTPTSPFRNPETMRRAWDYYTTHDEAGRIVSVKPYHDPPYWAMRASDPDKHPETPGCVQPIFPDLFTRTRTQLPPCVHLDGAHLIQGANGGCMVGFTVPPEESVDINTLEDLEYAEYLLARGRVTWIANN